MKKKSVRWLVLAAALILLAGCANPPPSNPPLPTPSVLPPASPSPTSTDPAPQPTLLPAASPTATTQPGLRFAVIGDYGSAGPSLAAVAALIDTWQVDLILTTGDNNYPLGSPQTIDDNIGQYFQAYIFPYRGNYGPGAEMNRFFPSMGNHDWIWQDGQPYLEYFELPGNERYYSFSRDFIDFFALSSDWDEPDGILPDSIQAEWLQAELAASDADWQVVYFHHAPYSSGYHGSTKHMQWPFQAWGADVVFSGHDHHYERLEVDGIPYIVQGISGGAIYAIYNVLPTSQVRYNETYGALLVEATPQQLWFGFYNIQGELVDEFIWQK